MKNGAGLNSKQIEEIERIAFNKNLLSSDVENARAKKEFTQYEIGGGRFEYLLKANIHGLLTYTPIFKRGGSIDKSLFNPLERLHKETFQPTTVARDENGFRVFAESKNGTLKMGRKLANEYRKKYNRNNKISERGTVLKGRGINIIKNSILHKYYTSGADYSGSMKFFTYTVQAESYYQKKQKFQKTKDLINSEKSRGLDEFRPFVPIHILDEIEKKNIHPDQFYIKKLSEHLENLTKRKGNAVESYVWTAEKTKKGVIHFHAVFECKFLSATQESRAWSERCGFVNRYNSVQYGFDRTNVRSDYRSKNEWGNNNLDPGAISAYLTKYVSKNQSEIFGRNYGMSKNFYKSSVKGTQRFVNPTFFIQDKEKKTGFMIVETQKIDYTTGEILKQKNYLPVKVIKTGSIQLPGYLDKTGNERRGLSVPTYTLQAPREKLLKYLFSKTYEKCSFLFDNQKDRVKQLAYV